MFGLQPIHLILILIIALIIFGPKRLPELGGALGKSITEFKESMREAVGPGEAPSEPAKASTQDVTAEGSATKEHDA